MNTFRVQRIRSCVQCGVVLGLKCKGCVAHPDRKPKTVEYFGWPKILKTCECSCSVMIACQRDGCSRTMWRDRTHSRDGMSRSAKLFCSPQCNCLVMAKENDTRVMVPCGWCDKPVRRKRSEVRTFKNAYCRQDHYFLAIRKKAHDDKQRSSAEDASRALLECLKCADVTEHREAPRDAGTATCNACGTVRSSRIKVVA